MGSLKSFCVVLCLAVHTKIGKGRDISGEEKAKNWRSCTAATESAEDCRQQQPDQVCRVQLLKDMKRVYCVPKPLGRPRKLSPRSVRSPINVAQRSSMTARKVMNSTDAPVSLRPVQRRLSDREFLEFGLLFVHPKLEARHLQLRYEWATTMSWVGPSKWRRTLFMDEKRFWLDGSDAMACFWANNRLPSSTFYKQQQGGGGLMIWDDIYWHAKTLLVFV